MRWLRLAIKCARTCLARPTTGAWRRTAWSRCPALEYTLHGVQGPNLSNLLLWPAVTSSAPQALQTLSHGWSLPVDCFWCEGKDEPRRLRCHQSCLHWFMNRFSSNYSGRLHFDPPSSLCICGACPELSLQWSLVMSELSVTLLHGIVNTCADMFSCWHGMRACIWVAHCFLVNRHT